jgi:thioredoxin-related protein
MRKIILILLVSTTVFTIKGQNTEINWMSLEEAIQAQAVSPRKIMMDVYTTWCGPCKMLDINTFQNPDVVKYISENYYAVKFDAEGSQQINFKQRVFKNPNYDPNRTGRNAQHELASAMGINMYPTIVFLNENGDILLPIPGYKTPAQLELYLKLFFNDDHQTINNQEQWNQYQKDFVFEFKG